MKNHFSFDLDGTIIDSEQSVNWSINASLRDLGMDDRDIKVVGPSLDDLVYSLGIGDLSVQKKIKNGFIFHYDENYCLNTKLYPQIEQTLRALKHRDVYLSLVTNKRKIPTMKILKNFGIIELFSEICCIDALGGKSKILKSLSVPNVENYYIGDLKGDYFAAKDAGYKFLHASWGYGNVFGVSKLDSAEEILKFAIVK